MVRDSAACPSIAACNYGVCGCVGVRGWVVVGGELL